MMHVVYFLMTVVVAVTLNLHWNSVTELVGPLGPVNPLAKVNVTATNDKGWTSLMVSSLCRTSCLTSIASTHPRFKSDMSYT